MNHYLIRVHFDEESYDNFDVIDVEADSFMEAINKAVRKLSPTQKQYMYSMQAFIRCESYMSE
jgi:DNA-binding protein YbaB